jgi:predicted DCC family thiol-disulfide oxidoreductase YuxK
MPAPMLVFDGDCGFCHHVVRFILAHEYRNDLLFIPRNSALGLSLREQYHLQKVESLLWIEDNRAFIEWQAVAHTAAYVGGIYARLASVAGLLPDALLNAGYRLIARIRKRLAGPPRHCLLLSAAQQTRFLE